jgi:hypothetical protein
MLGASTICEEDAVMTRTSWTLSGQGVPEYGQMRSADQILTLLGQEAAWGDCFLGREMMDPADSSAQCLRKLRPVFN